MIYFPPLPRPLYPAWAIDLPEDQREEILSQWRDDIARHDARRARHERIVIWINVAGFLISMGMPIAIILLLTQ